jgi:hypothetical protein
MAQSVQRTFSLEHSGDLTIVDEIAPRTVLSDVVWSLHTRARVRCDGRHAQLIAPDDSGLQERVLHVWLQGGDGAVFDAERAEPTVPYVACKRQEARNPGVTRLIVKLGQLSGPTRIMIRMSLAAV